MKTTEPTPDRDQPLGQHNDDRNLTRPQDDAETSLPHERDESPSGDLAKGKKNSPRRDRIEQAEEDVESGQVDTDLRGTPSNVPHQ